ncbi:MAG: hypothetical protein LBI31_00715 [Zoogloeaceae bacterium]|jgi:hypothetical protein|nr:hypothetical protein [Zoogloeaceae bacterium]
MASSAVAKEAADACKETCAFLKILERSGDLPLMVRIEKGLIRHELKEYANTENTKSGLEKALKDMEYIEKGIILLQNPELYRAANEAYLRPTYGGHTTRRGIALRWVSLRATHPGYNLDSRLRGNDGRVGGCQRYAMHEGIRGLGIRNVEGCVSIGAYGMTLTHSSFPRRRESRVACHSALISYSAKYRITTSSLRLTSGFAGGEKSYLLLE